VPGPLPLPHVSVSGSVSESETKWSMGFELELDPDPDLDPLDTASIGNGFGVAMSSSPLRGAFGEGDVDVAAPTLEWSGDVLIAMGNASERRRGRRLPDRLRQTCIVRQLEEGGTGSRDGRMRRGTKGVISGTKHRGKKLACEAIRGLPSAVGGG
jgi:hypothetical protein